MEDNPHQQNPKSTSKKEQTNQNSSLEEQSERNEGDLEEQEESNEEKLEEVEDSPSVSDILPMQVLEALPKEERKKVESSLSIMATMGRSSATSSLTRKLTSEHIGTIIDNQEKESQREFDLAKINENTKRIVIGSILSLVIIVFIYAGITKDKELSEKVIIAGISAIGGAGAGYAVGKSKSN